MVEPRSNCEGEFKPPATDDPDVQEAIRRLTALHEGFAGVSAAVGCGPRAIPALARVLKAPEPGGVFERRQRAAQALGALGATDALLDFLQSRHDQRDPVALAAEEAVVDAAARALIGARDLRIFSVLLDLAYWRPLSGVLEALAALHDLRAIPVLVEGLSEDHTRRTAAEALRGFGRLAVPALLERAAFAATGEPETVSSLRTRRSAIALIATLGAPSGSRERLRRLIADSDPEVAAHARQAWRTLIQ